MALYPSVHTYTPSNSSATAYATAVTGASFTLSSMATADGLARQVLFTNNSANSKAGINMTLVGTDADGNAQTEVLAGPGSSTTTTSAKFYKTLTSVTPASTFGADTMGIGTNGVWYGPTLPLNARNANAANIQASLSGTCTFTVSQVYDDVLQTPSPPAQSAAWTAITALSAKTATTVATATVAATAVRVSSASYTNGAVLTLTIAQPWTNVRA
jgi:hypothetical protein